MREEEEQEESEREMEGPSDEMVEKKEKEK
jgi:hypothetical protein